ncbi:MAG: GntR family transcriptional regulator [Thermoguttaceae bacterium]|jgi:DNA-binding GntR family transcriptional regulator|nr:GntR family transcriptional regulator [Thermoguttaceae bacterium]
MPFSKTVDESRVYDRLLKLVFSGSMAPGERLVERRLAEQLGVSRIPVRESVREMLAQGLLVGGDKWAGACTRNYTPAEVRQLSEYRRILEGGAARLAARHTDRNDLAHLDRLREETEKEVGNYGSPRWAQLDHEFHAALAQASHNERLIHTMQHLLAECHYVFYVYPRQQRRPELSYADAVAQMARVVKDHGAIVERIRQADADGAERLARAHLLVTGRQAASDLAGGEEL